MGPLMLYLKVRVRGSGQPYTSVLQSTFRYSSPSLLPTSLLRRPLTLQVLATVSPATTSMMSFLNTSSSLVHYMTLGQGN